MFVTDRRHHDTTPVLCVRHRSPSPWYNVSIFNVTVCRHYDTTLVLCVRHTSLSPWYNVSIVWTSQYAVTMIQASIFNVTVCRHYDITSAIFVSQGVYMIQRPLCLYVTVCRYFGITYALFERHGLPSPWHKPVTVFAIMIQRSQCMYVAVYRQYDTTPVLFVRHSMSLPCFFVTPCRSMVQRQYCVIVTVSRPHDINEATWRSGLSDSHQFGPDQDSRCFLDQEHLTSLIWNKFERDFTYELKMMTFISSKFSLYIKSKTISCDQLL